MLLAGDAVLLIAGRDPAAPERGRVVAHARRRGRGRRVAAKRRRCARCARRPASQVDRGRLSDPSSPPGSREFEFDGVHYHQTDYFFALAVERFTPGTPTAGSTPSSEPCSSHRWWSVADLEAMDDVVYPNELARLLRALAAGIVTEPMEIS